jgi:hypothetical protein
MKTQQQTTIERAGTSEGESVSEIQALTIRTRDLYQSLDFWNTAMVWALVFAAVAATAVVVTTRFALTRSKQLAAAQDELIRAKDAQLALDLKEKDVKIAQAGRDAAEANRIAEHERLARLQLEARLADRTLTAAQQARIASRLRGFGPQTIDVIVVGTTPEVSRITDAIVAAIRQAGWAVGNVGSPLAGAAAGVLIGTRKGSPKEVLAAADSLVAALVDTGIVSGPIPPYEESPPAIFGTWNPSKIAPIRMIVGTKP